MNESARQGDALPLATGKRPNGPRRKGTQLEALTDDPERAGGARAPMEPSRELDVLETCQIRVTERIVANPSERPSDFSSRSSQVSMIDAPRRRPREGADNRKDGRLAGTVRPVQHRDPAIFELQRDPGKRTHRAIGFSHVIEADQGVGGATFEAIFAR